MSVILRERVGLAYLLASIATCATCATCAACGGEVGGGNGDSGAGQDAAAEASRATDGTSDSRTDVDTSEAGDPDVVLPDATSTLDVAADVPISTTFACGSMSCTASSQFCYIFSGGPPPPPDASPGGGGQCDPIPAACKSTPTCACIRASIHLCVTMCTQVGDEITARCDAP